MDSSQLLASVAVALDKLQYEREQSISRSDELKLAIMIRGLRVVRTFLLCSTQLNEDRNDTLCSHKQKQNNSRMREDLGSLLIRVEDVVSKILDDHPYQAYDFRYDMESCEAEMDNWYTIFSAYSKKDSTFPLANRTNAILDSVLENLKDYLIFKRSYDFDFKRSYNFDLKEQLQQIEALQGNITVMKHIISFSDLLCTENQEFQCPLTNIEPLAISAAHFTLHLFSNIKGPMHRPNDATSSMLSALLLKINHACDPHLYVTSSFSTQIKRCLSHSIIVSCNKQLQNPVIALQLPGLSYIKMDSSQLLASVAVALHKLQYQRGCSDDLELAIMIRGLRVVRTFLLCTKQLTEENIFTQKQKQDNSRMREDLGSLLIGVEDVVRKILDDRIPYQPHAFRNDMESCEDEMDGWYTSFSAYLKKYLTSPLTNQIKAILDSVLEDLYLLISERSCDFGLKEQIEALQRNITVMRQIIYFGSLLWTENQEFQCLLTHIEPLAISAAHLTLRLFCVKGPMHLPKAVITFMVSALILRTNHADNPLLHEKYTLALASLKHSRELYDSTLDLNDYPFIVKMEHCIGLLSITFMQMLQLGTMVSFKDLLLYERLRLLRILVNRQIDRFNDDVKIRNLTVAIVGDAGVRIFLFYLKDSVNDHLLQCVLENSEVIWEEVLQRDVLETSTFNFPETNVLGFVDFLLEDYLMEVNRSNIDSNTLSCVPRIKEHLVFLKSFMGKLAELRKQQENLHQDAWNFAAETAYMLEFLIDQLVLGDVLDSFSVSLQSITEDICLLEADSLNLFSDQGRQDIFKEQQITCPSTEKVSSKNSAPIADEEVVGLESEKASIVNRLVRGLNKLKAIAVVGMAGLGKTTLATKVYRDSSVTHHFHVKAWCSISQVFDRRKVLLELLNQIQPYESNLTADDNDLSQKLWQSLRKRRYLIFLDDVWDTKAFDLLQQSFPDDSNQSRILLTSRLDGVVPEALLDDKPFFLSHLTVDKSLELLKKKLFPAQKDWPSELHAFGMEIADYCKGLPLTVVIIAGILKTTEQEGWKDVLKSLRSSIISDLTDQCGSTIELSYKHLHDHLKPCFLWFGSFPEDHEFSVKRMIWLWISDGLIREIESKSLEDVARDYMNNLIARSLVMNVEGRSAGGVKTCRIHDLLHDFCQRKADEEFFSHVLAEDVIVEQEGGELETLWIDEVEIICSSYLRNPRRLLTYSKPENLKWTVFCPRLRSLWFRCPTKYYQEIDLSYVFSMFKLLRVLNMDGQLIGFPSEIGGLVQLRYLEMLVDEQVPPAIGAFSNLETLIMRARKDVVSLPNVLWKLRKLRHLYVKDGSIELAVDDSNSSCSLVELQTMSTLYVREWSVLEKQLSKFPNIRQLKCKFVKDSKVMDFSFLSQLQSLSLRFSSSYGTTAPELIFPENIKKLTLSADDFSWNEFPMIAKLPLLEVLKLFYGVFDGDTWHVEEGDFPNLKFLKLEGVYFIKWTAASDDLFPNLEKLVLEYCFDIEEVPAECLQNAANLDTIEVSYCPSCVGTLLKSVAEFHKEMGNPALQFYVRNEMANSNDELTGGDNELTNGE